MIKLQNNIPLPARTEGGPEVSHAISVMDVGQSFIIPLEGKGPHYRNNLYAMAARHGVRITVRRTSSGYRVWRVE